MLFIQSLVPLESHKRFGTLLQIFLALWLVTSEAAAGGICNPRLSSTTSNEICYKNVRGLPNIKYKHLRAQLIHETGILDELQRYKYGHRFGIDHLAG